MQHEGACKGPDSPTRTCPKCGKVFAKRHAYGGHRAICLNGSALAKPEMRRQAMRKRSANMRYRKYLSDRMKKWNRERSVESRQRSTDGIRRAIKEGRVVPYGRGLGGGGKGGPPTKSENAVAPVLEPLRFVREHKVVTRQSHGEALWYSLDWAHPGRKIAVEIDGSSHLVREEVDTRKDRWLLRNGWAVIRIPAKMVKQALPWLRAVCSRSNLSRRRVHRFST